jgi:hypothetical protein
MSYDEDKIKGKFMMKSKVDLEEVAARWKAKGFNLFKIAGGYDANP